MNISATALVLLTAAITAVSTLLGVALTSLINLRAAKIAKESEERRHHKEVVVKAAIENWKQAAELWKSSGHVVSMAPLDTFLIHMSALADVIFDPSTNADNLESRLKTIDKLLEIADKSAKEPKRIPRPPMS